MLNLTSKIELLEKLSTVIVCINKRRPDKQPNRLWEVYYITWINIDTYSEGHFLVYFNCGVKLCSWKWAYIMICILKQMQDMIAQRDSMWNRGNPEMAYLLTYRSQCKSYLLNLIIWQTYLPLLVIFRLLSTRRKNCQSSK